MLHSYLVTYSSHLSTVNKIVREKFYILKRFDKLREIFDNIFSFHTKGYQFYEHSSTSSPHVSVPAVHQKDIKIRTTRQPESRELWKELLCSTFVNSCTNEK